jgi:hypothetical protein
MPVQNRISANRPWLSTESGPSPSLRVHSKSELPNRMSRLAVHKTMAKNNCQDESFRRSTASLSVSFNSIFSGSDRVTSLNTSSAVTLFCRAKARV